MEPRVFISHSSADKDFALRLDDALRSFEIAVWTYEREIHLSQRWAMEVQRGLDECTHMVVLCSESALQSAHVWDEHGYYLNSEQAKPVIPLLIAETRLPFTLASLQHLNVCEIGFDEAVAKLVEFILSTSLDPTPDSTLTAIREPMMVDTQEMIGYVEAAEPPNRYQREQQRLIQSKEYYFAVQPFPRLESIPINRYRRDELLEQMENIVEHAFADSCLWDEEELTAEPT